jgi:poly(glycerol-phosphate) alpha-glucosyltransferase
MLVVAGPGEGGHEEEMKRLTAELGLEPRVCFTGPLQGQEKLAALAGAELFVLPSFSEGFSMAVLEAAAAGLPVLLTPQCNFPELVRASGAIEVSPDVAGCEAGLRELLGLPDAERRLMGQRGKDLVARSYTWPRIVEQMLSVYHWLLEGGTPPACVRLN